MPPYIVTMHYITSASIYIIPFSQHHEVCIMISILQMKWKLKTKTVRNLPILRGTSEI